MYSINGVDTFGPPLVASIYKTQYITEG